MIEPIVASAAKGNGDTYNDDVSYVRDLGLIAPDRPLRIANPIYKEVIVRVLSDVAGERIFEWFSTGAPPQRSLSAGRASRKRSRPPAAR